eukprot:TRINITY_DN57450_c0_g1_i1.p1 TRINITY_DN57450_c0_g1~~TRINITY_DN57450_c0_g1_i1.p1  ORF type:complete len:362 (-),score=72.58 TRINITY_DN57450_c0_g1_i1:2-1087(-)
MVGYIHHWSQRSRCRLDCAHGARVAPSYSTALLTWILLWTVQGVAHGAVPAESQHLVLTRELEQQEPELPEVVGVMHALWEHVPRISMVSLAGMRNTVHLLLAADRLGIPGDFAELGVWRGGMSLLMAMAMVRGRARYGAYHGDRRMWLFDTFSGFGSNNTGVDAVFNDVDNSAGGWERVVELFRSYFSLDRFAVFFRGPFHETLPRLHSSQAFAVLRLDCDMYSSLMDALCYMYDLLNVGGFVIIDDWGSWPQAKLAVGTFLEETGLRDEVTLYLSEYDADPWHKYEELSRLRGLIPHADNVGGAWWQKLAPSRVLESAVCRRWVAERGTQLPGGLTHQVPQRAPRPPVCSNDCWPSCCI